MKASISPGIDEKARQPQGIAHPGEKDIGILCNGVAKVTAAIETVISESLAGGLGISVVAQHLAGQLEFQFTLGAMRQESTARPRPSPSPCRQTPQAGRRRVHAVQLVHRSPAAIASPATRWNHTSPLDAAPGLRPEPPGPHRRANDGAQGGKRTLSLLVPSNWATTSPTTAMCG